MLDPRSFDFRSDNVAGCAPEVLEALASANAGAVPSYGADPISDGLRQRLADTFDHPVWPFLVATGTAANALSLAHLVPPWGGVLCHRDAHIATDECGAPEYLGSGLKLILVDGDHGKLTAETVARQLAKDVRGVHHVQPAAISLSQSTEAGTVYQPAEIARIAEIGRAKGLRLHLDGARLANAVAALGCAPADVSWRAGVDALSFGLTKTGALAAEAVLFFDEALARDFEFRRKRAGHLYSKMRFASAQFEALLRDGAWLRLAARANAMARRLADGLATLPGLSLRHPVEANEIFLRLPESTATALERAGYLFYRWEDPDGPLIRLVTAFDTEPDHVDLLLGELNRIATRIAG